LDQIVAGAAICYRALLKAPNESPTIDLHAFEGIVHFEINFWYVLSYLNFDSFRSNRSCRAV